jgi:pyruvate dehydrogenase E2 component (dihydrolipoamide acetyltransferase)
VRVEVKMANLGYDMEVGKVVSWLKNVGDSVARGEPITEVETDKATVEMESMQSGVLVEIVAAEGAEVPVGAVIAYLDTPE